MTPTCPHPPCKSGATWGHSGGAGRWKVSHSVWSILSPLGGWSSYVDVYSQRSQLLVKMSLHCTHKSAHTYSKQQIRGVTRQSKMSLHCSHKSARTHAHNHTHNNSSLWCSDWDLKGGNSSSSLLLLASITVLLKHVDRDSQGQSVHQGRWTSMHVT